MWEDGGMIQRNGRGQKCCDYKLRIHLPVVGKKQIFQDSSSCQEMQIRNNTENFGLDHLKECEIRSSCMHRLKVWTQAA